MDYLSQDDFDTDPLIQQWTQLAQTAMNDGSDPARVNSKLRAAMEKRGYDTASIQLPLMPSNDPKWVEDNPDTVDAIKSAWNTPNKETKQDYKDAVVPDVVQEGTKLDVPNSPSEFANVESGVESVKKPKTISERIQEVGSQMASGAEGVAEGGDYPVQPDDDRKLIGMPEGTARGALDIATGLAKSAYDWSPPGMIARTVGKLTGIGDPIGTEMNAGEEAVHENAGLDDDKVRFQGPREEAVSRAIPELLANLIPMGEGSKAAKSLLDEAAPAKGAADVLKTGDEAVDAGINLGTKIHDKIDSKSTPDDIWSAMKDELGFGDEAKAPEATVMQESNTGADKLGTPIAQAVQEQAAPPPAEAPVSMGPDRSEATARVDRDALLQQAEKAKSEDVRLSTFDTVRPDGAGVFQKNAIIPDDIRRGLDAGTVTGDHVLSAIIDDPEGLFKHAPEAKAFAEDMYKRGEQLGGLDTKIEVLDYDNPVHQESMSRNPMMADSAAMYDPVNNRIYINKDANMATLAHEVGHAVSHKAISMGEARQLDGPAQTAFDTFQNLFDTLKPKLDTWAEGVATEMNATGKTQHDVIGNYRQRTYGMKDPHEFMSEMWSSQAFRNHLREMKITEPEQLKLGLGRAVVGRVRNMYDAVMKLTNKMLGLSPKAENALDAMFSAQKDFFGKIDSHTSGGIRDYNMRNTKGEPDMSFLGEQAPGRFADASGAAAAQQPELRRGHGKIESFLRNAFLPKGDVPEVTDAAKQAFGPTNAGRVEATAFKNSARAWSDGVSDADIFHVMKSTPLAGEAMARIRKTSPQMADLLNKARVMRTDNNVSGATKILSDPNVSPAQKKLAQTFLETRNNYLTKTYAGTTNPKITEQLFKAADAGDATAKQVVSEARDYLEGKFLPGADKIDKLSTAQLRELYRVHTGLDPSTQFKGMEKADAKLLMQTAVKDKLSALGQVHGQGAWLDNAVKEAAGLDKDNLGQIARFYSSARRGAGMFATRSKVPPALQKLWGAVTDPIMQTASTIEKQAAFHAQLDAQATLRSTGLENGIFSKVAKGEHQVILNGDGLGPLQGLYTTPNVARALDVHRVMSARVSDLMDLAAADSSGRHMLGAVGKAAGNVLDFGARTNKAVNILTNPGNFIENAVGVASQLASNGNYNPKFMAGGIKDALDVIGLSLKKGKNLSIEGANRGTLLSPQTKFILKHNISEYSQIQELQHAYQSTKFRDVFDNIAQAADPLKALKALYQSGKIAKDVYSEIYGHMDLFSKYANLRKDQELWQPILEKKGWNQDKIDNFIADRVNSNNITPSDSPGILRTSERKGLTMYGTYKYQVAKVIVNNARTAVSDFRFAIANNEPKLALDATARLAGVSASVVMFPAMYKRATLAIGGVFGLAAAKLDDDSPIKKYLDSDDFTRQIDPVVFSDPKNPKAGQIVVDASRPDPFGPMTQLGQRAIEAMSKWEKGDKKGAAESLDILEKNLADTVWSPNSLYRQAYNFAVGKRPGEARYDPEGYQARIDKAQEYGVSPKNTNRAITASELFTPKGYKNYELGKNAIPGDGDSKVAKVVQMGLGAQPLNIGDDIQKYMGHKMAADITDARAPYLATLTQVSNPSKASLDKDFLNGLKSLKEPYDHMEKAVEAAKAQGLTQREVGMRLLDSGVNKDVAAMLYAGKPVPALMMLGDPIKSLQTAQSKEMDPDRRKKMAEHNREKIEALRDIISKYKDVTFEDLEKM